MTVSLVSTNIGTKILKLLSERENVYISALPGMGLNTLSKDISQSLVNESNGLIINIYPHEENQKIDKLIISKVKIENEIVDQDQLQNLTQLVEYLKKENKHVIGFIHKIYQFERSTELINYLLSLRLSSNRRISLYVDNVLGKEERLFNSKLHNHSFNRITFNGIDDNHHKFISSFCNQLNMTPLSISETNIVMQFTAGHIGLIIDLLKFLRNGGSLNSDLTDIYKYPSIANRLTIISNCLFDNGVTSKMILEPNLQVLGEFGITFNGNPMTILKEFIRSKNGMNELIRDVLTETEFRIYTFLEANNTVPKKIEEILDHLGNNSFEEKTNWAIYKHISNINRKVLNHNLQIKGHRKRGYLLTKLTKPI